MSNNGGQHWGFTGAYLLYSFYYPVPDSCKPNPGGSAMKRRIPPRSPAADGADDRRCSVARLCVAEERRVGSFLVLSTREPPALGGKLTRKRERVLFIYSLPSLPCTAPNRESNRSMSYIHRFGLQGVTHKHDNNHTTCANVYDSPTLACLHELVGKLGSDLTPSRSSVNCGRLTRSIYYHFVGACMTSCVGFCLEQRRPNDSKDANRVRLHRRYTSNVGAGFRNVLRGKWSEKCH
jgi:hypothetical protein